MFISFEPVSQYIPKGTRGWKCARFTFTKKFIQEDVVDHDDDDYVASRKLYLCQKDGE